MSLLNIDSKELYEDIESLIYLAKQKSTDPLCRDRLEYIYRKAWSLIIKDELYKLVNKFESLSIVLASEDFYIKRKIVGEEYELLKKIQKEFAIIVPVLHSEEKLALVNYYKEDTVVPNSKERLPNNLTKTDGSMEMLKQAGTRKELPNSDLFK